MISSPNKDFQPHLTPANDPRSVMRHHMSYALCHENPSNNARIGQQQHSRTRTILVHYPEHNHHRILHILQSCDASHVQAWNPVLLSALVCAVVERIPLHPQVPAIGSYGLSSYLVCTSLLWRPATLSKNSLAVVSVCESSVSAKRMEIPV